MKKQQSAPMKTLKIVSSAGVSWLCPWGEAWHIVASQDPAMDCLSEFKFSLSIGRENDLWPEEIVD